MAFPEGQECTETPWGEYNYSAHVEPGQSHMTVDRLCSAHSSPSRIAVGGSHVVGRTVRRPF